MSNKIVFEHDGRHRKAIIYDGKSYALLGFDEKLTVKGNTLRGRGNEPFMNQFIEHCIWYVFSESPELIRDEYDYWYRRIENKDMTADEVCKRENINMSLETYRNKISAGQNPIATYEAALQADRSYVKGDTIVTWIEEPAPVLKEYKTKPDVWRVPKNASSYENIRLGEHFNGNIYRHHYHSRLETAVKRFLVVLGIDRFKEMFPELSVLKDDKAKFIPVLGLKEFHERYPDYRWREKDVKKLSEKDVEKFGEYIDNGYIDEEYKTLIENNE